MVKVSNMSFPDQRFDDCSCGAPSGEEGEVIIAKLRHRLLNDAPPNTNATNQATITVNLAVLLSNRVAQIHAPSQSDSLPKKIPKVATTR